VNFVVRSKQPARGAADDIHMKSFVFTLLAILLLSNAALADDPLAKPTDAEAREHLSAGNKLYRVREFEKAVEEYKAGALKQDVPVFHYNLGQCYRQLGRYEEAIWHYERFLDRGHPTGELKSAVDAFVTQMKSELEKKAMTQPPVEPAPDPKQQPAPQPVQPIAPVVVDAPPWYSDPIGWGLTGAGVVSLGVSGALFLTANGIDDDANAEPSQQARMDLRDNASGRRTIATIVGVGGAALLVGGVVKLAIRPATQERPATTLNVGITSNGIQVFGTF
jgi:tetratricopeptide (TPR) repeat protein